MIFQNPICFNECLSELKDLFVKHSNNSDATDLLEQVQLGIVFLMNLRLLYKVLYSNTSASEDVIEVLEELKMYFKRNKLDDEGIWTSDALVSTLETLIELLKIEPHTIIASKCSTLVCEALRDVMRGMGCRQASDANPLLRILYHGCELDLQSPWVKFKSIRFLSSTRYIIYS